MSFDIFKTSILAFIQGFTEFLPISSSAHLIFPSALLGWDDQGLAFDVAVHLGTLAAVVFYFRSDIYQIFIAWCKNLVTREVSNNSRLGWMIIAATFPVVIVGFLFKDFIDAQFRTVAVIASTSIIFGLLLLYSDIKSTGSVNLQSMSWKNCLIIGLSQALALIPGTSRSGATMTAALLCNLDRESAARFSFLLSIPAISGAALLLSLDLLDAPSVNWLELIYAMGLSAIFAYLCIHYFLKLITAMSFLPFVVYRLMLGVVLFLFFTGNVAQAQTMSEKPLSQSLYYSDSASDNPYKIIIRVDQLLLDDLQGRLSRTRWPDEIENANWDYGTNMSYLKELVNYWAEEYEWKTEEAWINSFNHYKSDADGIKLHYIHQKSPDENAIPLLLLHGWPSSFVQMLDIIPMLTNPAAHGMPEAPSFDVVAASLPGFGFSDAPTQPGMGMESIAGHMSFLMTEVLGYDQYGARGSDLGGTVIDQLARHYPEQLIGIHLSGIIVAGGAPEASDATQAEKDFLNASAVMAESEISYARQHMTKPQTLAYGLNDSPSGLAAWIIEKYYAWGDTNGDIESRFSKEFLLTMLNTFWFTETINPSIRTYYDMVRNRGNTDKINVPVGMLMSHQDLFPFAPKEYAERSYNIVHWSETNTGGHFLEWEEPKLVSSDIQAFFKSL